MSDGEGQFLTLKQVKGIISRFDDNGDGVLQYEEFAQLWMAKRRSAMGEKALRRAYVVCGYNEVGQQLCNLLDKANIAGIPYVAFARKTEQISTSVSSCVLERTGEYLLIPENSLCLFSLRST